MTDIHAKRALALEAARLLDSELLQAVLTEIEGEAQAAFLASGGDPAKMTAAFHQSQAVQTLRVRLQTRITDARIADQREQRQ